MLVAPALYAAPDSLLRRLNRFVENGGHIVYTFKSGFCDENVKVRNIRQPGILSEACGISYSQFVSADRIPLKGDPFVVGEEDNRISGWAELISPAAARVLAEYDHPYWGKYAAVTQNRYGKGVATYVGCMTGGVLMEKILEQALKMAGLWEADPRLRFPLIAKSGINRQGKAVHYYFNYSDRPDTISYPYKNGKELLEGRNVISGEEMKIEPWGILIIEES